MNPHLQIGTMPQVQQSIYANDFAAEMQKPAFDPSEAFFKVRTWPRFKLGNPNHRSCLNHAVSTISRAFCITSSQKLLKITERLNYHKEKMVKEKVGNKEKLI